MAEQDISARRDGPVSAQRIEEAVAECRRRLEYVARNYKMMRSTETHCLTFNASLARMARATNPRSRLRMVRARLDPVAEILVDHRARNISGDGELTAATVTEAARQIAGSLKPIRGRPTDVALTYHVQALMALWYEFTGKSVTASRTEDSVYEPRMTSIGGRAIETIMQSIDPKIARTSIVNVIISTNAKDKLWGKTFQDFFPFYGGSIAPDEVPSPGPGYRLESFMPSSPIYYS